MARKRFRRKDLKRPDQFMSTAQQVLLWCVDNRVQLLRGAAVAGVVVLLGGGYLALRSSRAQQAGAELGRALSALSAQRYSEAATQLSDLGQRWGSTPSGRLAPLYAASAFLKAGEPNRATAALDPARSASFPDYLQQQVPLLLALAREESGDLAAAVQEFRSAAERPGPYTALALLGEARTRKALGEKVEARALYERFLREFPQDPDADLVKSKLQSLNG
jgi:predicted negative regulator of RcsB-dependent stress response